MSQLFQELKRRNVVRVAVAYLAVAWLILQAADIVLGNIAAPPWLMQALIFFMVVGFPVAVIFAWAFEMTPEGIKKEADVVRSASIAPRTGKKLDRFIMVVLSIAVVFLLLDKFVLHGSSTIEKSVAVLPFVAMSRGPDDEYFAAGLTEEILNSLTRLPELLVTARTSSFHFKGKDVPVPEIAAALGVAHVVEGSVRRDGDRLRVTAQLIRATDGFHLWSANYDRQTKDTFGVQTDIADKIATALDVVMDEERRQKMHAAGVRNPEAFVAFQKGVELYRQAHGSATMLELLLEANGWLDLAIELEPGFADAYLYRSDYFTHFLIDSIEADNVSVDKHTEAMRNIVQNHENAIRLAASEAARIDAAYDLAAITGQWRNLPALLDGLAGSGGCGAGSGWLLETSVPYGRAKTALSVALAGINCDPIRWGGWVHASTAYLYLGDFDAAIEVGNRGIEAAPHVRIYQALFFAYLAAGRFDEAESLINLNIHRDNQSLPLRVLLAAARGDAALAETQLAALVESRDIVRPPIVQLAVSGDHETANKIAARLDARPSGHLALMIQVTICRCGAPFDLEVTPNFAKLIHEADFPWPPASPIDWPLKDW